MFLLAACGSTPAEGPALTFDPCEVTTIEVVNGSAAQAASVDDAIAMWRDRGIVDLVRGEPAQLSIEFRDAGAAFYGFYDDTTARVFVNTSLVDDEQRAVTIAHELGHAIGLLHVTDRVSVMNPGNLAITPTPDDVSALEMLWGTCVSAPP